MGISAIKEIHSMSIILHNRPGIHYTKIICVRARVCVCVCMCMRLYVQVYASVLVCVSGDQWKPLGIN